MFSLLPSIHTHTRKKTRIIKNETCDFALFDLEINRMTLHLTVRVAFSYVKKYSEIKIRLGNLDLNTISCKRSVVLGSGRKADIIDQKKKKKKTNSKLIHNYKKLKERAACSMCACTWQTASHIPNVCFIGIRCCNAVELMMNFSFYFIFFIAMHCSAHNTQHTIHTLQRHITNNTYAICAPTSISNN